MCDSEPEWPQRQPESHKNATIGAERTLLTDMRRILNNYLNVQWLIMRVLNRIHALETFEQGTNN